MRIILTLVGLLYMAALVIAGAFFFDTLIWLLEKLARLL